MARTGGHVHWSDRNNGNIYYGLWYPIVVAAATVVIGVLFIPETKDRDIYKDG